MLWEQEWFWHGERRGPSVTANSLSLSLLLRSRRWSAKGNAGRKVRVGIDSKCLAGFSCNALVDEPIRLAGKERNGMGLKGLPRGREG